VNDAARGVVIILALMAWIYAARLAVVFARRALRHRGVRSHITSHVLLMTAAVTVNSIIAISTSVGRAGENQSLVWEEPARALAQALIIAALVVLIRGGSTRRPQPREIVSPQTTTEGEP
jgi:hypothetical protein